MKLKLKLMILTFVLSAGVLIPESAQARMFFFQFGEVLNEVGALPKAALKELPSDVREQEGPSAPVAAYKCTELSILWTLMYRTDCTPVVVRSGTVLKSKDAGVNKAMSAAVGEAYPAGVPEGEGWELYGKWVVGAGFIFAFILPFFRRSAF